MKRPKVTTRCVAGDYQAPNERIVEFSGSQHGGLMSFRELEDGTLHIEVYRADSSVWVHVGGQVIQAAKGGA